MKKQPVVYNIGSYEIEYSRTYPVVNGKTITSKEGVVKFFCQLLKDVGYHFDPIERPTPSILINWRDLDGAFLRRWLKKCFTQLTQCPLDIIKLSILDIDGFCIVDNVTRCNYQLVHMKLTAVDYSNEITCTIGNVSAIVSRFMTSNYVNKQVVIN